MTNQRKSSSRALWLLLVVCLLIGVPATARADEPEFDALTKYIQQNYQAKRVKIPFLGLARFAVKLIRPAGVKSFKVAIFENIKLEHSSAMTPLNLVMREVLPADWQPLLRIRTREGEQMYVFAREAGKDIKLLIASIEQDEAVVARVKFSPIALAKWMQDPKIMGVSLK